MPWYPKEYGDFSLKLQWRDSSTGTNGNSGIFARFPHPDEAVARPACQRYPCQVGSATSQPAWVAIYCGHEIQINDHQGDTQKTGSIYNFSPNNETQAQIQPRGTWVDYELRVVGQQYTIIRNGNVIKSFLNAPDQQSSRPGDPPTNDSPVRARLPRPPEPRRRRRGRLPQRPRAAARRGRGHAGRSPSRATASTRSSTARPTWRATRRTIKSRHVHDRRRRRDAAGDDARARPGTGRRTGPVTVTLSATDPDEPGGGGPAETHDVNALPSSWNPNTVQAATGDVVRWNFPEATAGAPHNVWLIEPGEAPDSAGHQVTDEVVSARRAAGVRDARRGRDLDLRVQDPLARRATATGRGMVGTAQVSAAGGTPGSGVDFTEYSLDGGGPGALRQHRGRRSVRELVHGVGAGRPHGRVPLDGQRRQRSRRPSRSSSRSPRRTRRPDGRAAPPTRRRARRRCWCSSRPPAAIRRTARSIYEWDFGDGGGTAARARSTRTRRRAGTRRRSRSPTSRARPGTAPSRSWSRRPAISRRWSGRSADPGEGDGAAGGRVQRGRARSRRRRSRRDLPVGLRRRRGANAFGRDVQHTYRTQGNYTATVTATDSDGISTPNS